MAPTYQWFKNTMAVGTGATYSVVCNQADVVYVVMTSNAPFATGNPATSNSVTMTVNPAVVASVTAVASANSVKTGTTVVFTATPVNGGTTPTYEWFKNNVSVGTTNVYSFIPVNGDVVYVALNSNASPCLIGSPVHSGSTTMLVSTGIDDLNAPKIVIYAENKNIFVSCSERAKQILIYNTVGSLIKIENNVDGLKKFNMNDKPNACYFVKIVTDGRVYSQKVLLK